MKSEKALNFRDVGRAINSITSTSTLRLNHLYRSAHPDFTTTWDRSLLSSNYGIKTIIDLRSQVERINVAKANCASNFNFSMGANQLLPEIWPSRKNHAFDVTHAHISLHGWSFQRYLISSLSWPSLVKFLFLLALGYRDSAIAILGREVVTPRGLIGFGRDILDHSTGGIKSCFDILCNPNNYPVMVYCTQGKDRTGLIILLILLLCEVPCPAVEKEYAMSEEELEPNREERILYLKAMGLNESFAGCPTDFVEKIIEHLNEQHGGLIEYLAKIGVNREAQERVKHILVQ